MNLKTKIFGLAAATALSLSMMTGVAAASSDSAGAKVTVNPGTCSAAITEANVDFGVWFWNGTEYVRQSGNNVQTLNGVVTNAVPNGTCDFTISFSNVSDIPMSSFYANAFGLEGTLGGWANGGVPVTLSGGAHSGTLTLTDIPSSVSANGLKSGTITISTVGGAS